MVLCPELEVLQQEYKERALQQLDMADHLLGTGLRT